MKHALASLWMLAMVAGSANAAGPSTGADVIVGEIEVNGPKPGDSGRSGIYVTTISCNAGSRSIPWQALPSEQHPIITTNIYRLDDGVLTQIGQAGVKHGFAALNEGGVCRNWSCERNGDDTALGPGCSDPYWGSLIERIHDVGPRSAINPATGQFNGATAASAEAGALGRILQVNDSDLAIKNARYFLEVQYISAKDIQDGNQNNNVSYREMSVAGSPKKWHFRDVGRTIRGCPAVFAWSGAAISTFDMPTGGRIFVAVKSTPTADGYSKTTIGIYNMTSGLPVSEVKVAVPATQLRNISFHAPFSHGESWAQDAWSSSSDPSGIAWRAPIPSPGNDSANAIRWGQMFTFSFESQGAPQIGGLSIVSLGNEGASIPIALDGSATCDPDKYYN